MPDVNANQKAPAAKKTLLGIRGRVSPTVGVRQPPSTAVSAHLSIMVQTGAMETWTINEELGLLLCLGLASPGDGA